MPLLIFPFIILYFTVVIAITYSLTKKQNSTKKKWLFGVLLPCLFFIGPFSDEFIAKPYFYSLCEKEGGLKIYRTVTIDDTFFDKNHELKLLSMAENIEDIDIKGRYIGQFGKIIRTNTIFNIREVSVNILDIKEKEKIAEFKMFLYGNGYIINKLLIAMPSQPIKCHKITTENIEIMLKKVFLKEKY